MSKLTKLQAKNHAQAITLSQQDTLTYEEKMFVIEHFHEGANHPNGLAGAFFTPNSLAWDFSFFSGADNLAEPRVIDLCAGIGILAFNIFQRNPNAKITCVEFNADYIAIGKKILPEANWVQADIRDVETIMQLGAFDIAVSNPPFGNTRTLKGFEIKAPYSYHGQHAEYKVIDLASRIARFGSFILPQESAGFKYSNMQQYSQNKNKRYTDFVAQTGIQLDPGMGIDTKAPGYGDFKDVSIVVEFVDANFDECHWKTQDMFATAI